MHGHDPPDAWVDSTQLEVPPLSAVSALSQTFIVFSRILETLHLSGIVGEGQPNYKSGRTFTTTSGHELRGADSSCWVVDLSAVIYLMG